MAEWEELDNKNKPFWRYGGKSPHHASLAAPEYFDGELARRKGVYRVWIRPGEGWTDIECDSIEDAKALAQIMYASATA